MSTPNKARALEIAQERKVYQTVKTLADSLPGPSKSMATTGTADPATSR